MLTCKQLLPLGPLAQNFSCFPCRPSSEHDHVIGPFQVAGVELTYSGKTLFQQMETIDLFICKLLAVHTVCIIITLEWFGTLNAVPLNFCIYTTVLILLTEHLCTNLAYRSQCIWNENMGWYLQKGSVLILIGTVRLMLRVFPKNPALMLSASHGKGNFLRLNVIFCFIH